MHNDTVGEAVTTRFLDATTGEGRAAAIEAAARLLCSGRLVAFPTETVYGLGADAFDAEAIARVYVAKGRPSDNPLIVHLADPSQIERCGRSDARVRALAAAFMPGPLTLVIAARDEVPLTARAGLPTVAVRVPDHPVARALLGITGPLVAPSANRSGRPSPTTAAHVMADLGGRIAGILDGGACRVGIESTVVDLSGGEPAILRPGATTPEAIAAVLGAMPVIAQEGDRRTVASPGTRHRHYAPEVPVRLELSRHIPVVDVHTVVLTTERHAAKFTGARVRLLKAETLYAELRRAESELAALILIYAEPDELPPGLLDRVSRAAAT